MKELTAGAEMLLRDQVSGLEPEEVAVLALLCARLKSASSQNGPASLRKQLRASIGLGTKSQHLRKLLPAQRRTA